MPLPNIVVSALLAGALLGAAATAWGDDPCAGFKWDVSKERALFGGKAEPLRSAKKPGSAPIAALNKLYEALLAPQDEVAFAAPPGKGNVPGDAHAGLAVVRIVTPGSYRISLDGPVWIDMVSHGSLVKAEDFQGQHGCDAPHKIVAFNLAGPGLYMMQISASVKERVRLTITPTPVRTQ
jgi:hypothetical protein